MMHHVTQSEEKELQYTSNLQIGKIIILVLTGIKFDTSSSIVQNETEAH
jgi:hypothetical protein